MKILALSDRRCRWALVSLFVIVYSLNVSSSLLVDIIYVYDFYCKYLKWKCCCEPCMMMMKWWWCLRNFKKKFFVVMVVVSVCLDMRRCNKKVFWTLITIHTQLEHHRLYDESHKRSYSLDLFDLPCLCLGNNPLNSNYLEPWNHLMCTTNESDIIAMYLDNWIECVNCLCIYVFSYVNHA